MKGPQVCCPETKQLNQITDSGLDDLHMPDRLQMQVCSCALMRSTYSTFFCIQLTVVEASGELTFGPHWSQIKACTLENPLVEKLQWRQSVNCFWGQMMGRFS